MKACGEEHASLTEVVDHQVIRVPVAHHIRVLHRKPPPSGVLCARVVCASYHVVCTPTPWHDALLLFVLLFFLLLVVFVQFLFFFFAFVSFFFNVSFVRFF